MVDIRKFVNNHRPDRKSALFLLPSNAALFLKGLHTRLARRLAGQFGDSAQLLGLALLCIGQLGFCFCDVVHVQRHQRRPGVRSSPG